MKIKLLLLSLLLSGCSLSVTTYSWEMQQSAEYCGGLEKVSTIYYNTFNGSRVTCTDGSAKWLRQTANAENAN